MKCLGYKDFSMFINNIKNSTLYINTYSSDDDDYGDDNND